ncbi:MULTISPECIES: hypothetical protein [unclassified Paenibacillus]|uniref:hypothetical protein n=1 Tax=unclassified Paenibacillus TaxID=185978 RepID=UPI000B92B362|nr:MULTISPECIES: hypothetical protein [unclassified Paenibacillus]ASS66579.1 hypothetical protein CIC07_10705 [Paenibacillus sp. RUD330]
MKRILAGGFILFSGVLLYLGVHLAAAMHLPHTTAWSTPPGKYGTALRETGGYAANLVSILFMIGGSLILLIELYFPHALARYKKALAERAMEYEKEHNLRE